ncbi:hypothetical protein CRM22_008057 [Opisthorchis felineus]|uniref:Ig-like domain-containing protein n=1 Tax=Opisthorchis felineus TaxID=147828 RepID=A0A4S2LK18_OPIFE|nr:hypothetical protein CRM22_008057 [Opisthorchis felineus]
MCPVQQILVLFVVRSTLSWEDSTSLQMNKSVSEKNRIPLTSLRNSPSNDRPDHQALHSPTQLFPSKYLESYDAVNGTRVELPCHIEIKMAAADFANVSWLKMPRRILTRGALRITRDHRIHLLPQSVESTSEFPLVIDPIREQDAGEYRCLVQIGSKLHHKVVILVVKVPPYFEERPPRIVAADERGNLRLFCKVSGTPKPKLRWWVLLGAVGADEHTPFNRPLLADVDEQTYLSSVLDPNVTETWSDLHSERGQLRPIETILGRHKNHIFVRGGLLVFSQVRRQMTGRYFCEGRNGIPPSAISESRLLVRYAPEVKMSHTELQQYLGRSTIIGCTIQAYPVGNVEWELNGIPIHATHCEVYPSMEVKYCQDDYHKLAYSSEIKADPEENEQFSLLLASAESTGSKPNSKEKAMLYRFLESRLIVTNITHADLGVYTCRMRNTVGVGEDYTRSESDKLLLKSAGLLVG